MTTPDDVTIGQLRRVTVQPGDLYVLTTPYRLSEHDHAVLQEEWHLAVGDRAKLLIVDNGDLTVCRHAPADNQETPR